MVPPLIGPGKTIRKSGGGSHRLSADFHHSLARGKQMGGVLEMGGQDVILPGGGLRRADDQEGRSGS